MAMLPLQWPLVGRHDELETFLASLADPRAHGFVIHGPAGVGKTRLADQCLALADHEGRNVSRATATEGARETPLGALAHLLPAGIADDRVDLVAVVAAVRPVVLDLANDGPLVLFVDDLHLLDGTSAALVAQLVDADLVFLVATVRTPEPVPPGLESLWHRARVRRIDLLDLDRPAIDTLLHLVLGGPVEATTSGDIWAASEGNVLLVRELVLGALERGHLLDQRGVWRLTGPLVTTPRLHELVSARLASLDTERPSRRSSSSRCGSRPAWPSSRRPSGETHSKRSTAGAFSPCVPTVAANRSASRTRCTARSCGRRCLGSRVAASCSIWPTGSKPTALVAARTRSAWRPRGSRRPAPRTPICFSRRPGWRATATTSPRSQRLGRAAALEGVTPEVGLLLGEALHELGEFDEAERVLQAAEAAAADDDALLVPIIELHTRNLMWGLSKPTEALEHNRAARDRLSGHPSRSELTLNEAMLLTYSGRPLDILSVLESADPPRDARERSLRAHAELPALVAIGKCATAAEEALRAFAEQRDLPDQIAIPTPEVHLITRMYALAECGRLAEASALASGAYQAMPPSAPPDAFMWLAQQQGRCALLSGQVETACRWLGEAAARCLDERARRASSPRAVRARGGGCMCGRRSDRGRGRARGRRSSHPSASLSPNRSSAGAGLSSPAATCRRRARHSMMRRELARSAGYRGAEAWLLHEIVRLGDPASVVGRLEELADICEGELVPAYAMHAEAAASRRTEGLIDGGRQVRVDRRAAPRGRSRCRGRAGAAASGDRRASAAMSVRASTLAESCEGARTPALTIPVMVTPLTRRERDIATLAAQGVSSKDIADRLFLSVRTVNNHLQNVYSKLGVGGRQASSPAALADVSDGAVDGSSPSAPSIIVSAVRL